MAEHAVENTRASSEVVSDEVKRKLEKGMRIISDIEQTRPDGMMFKFELDLMYEVRSYVM